MSQQVTVTLLSGAVAAIVSGGIAVYGQLLAAQKAHRRSKQDALEDVVRRFREPIAAASFELQSRLWNVVRGGLLEAYIVNGSDEEAEYCRSSFAWLTCTYLGWVEALRHELEHLDLGDVARNAELQRTLLAVRHGFRTDHPDISCPLRIFSADQRAIGEIMRSDGGSCLGYATFCARLGSPEFERWVSPLVRDVEFMAGHPEERSRLSLLQNRLVDLLDLLDPEFERYPADERTRLG